MGKKDGSKKKQKRAAAGTAPSSEGDDDDDAGGRFNRDAEGSGGEDFDSDNNDGQQHDEADCDDGTDGVLVHAGETDAKVGPNAPNEEGGDDLGKDDGDDEFDGKAKEKKEEEKEKKTKKKKKKKKEKVLSLESTESFNAKLRRRGVLYLSRIPPRMGPAKVKSLLGDFGTVTRVYLVEEDKAARKRRRRLAGGGKSGGGGKRYTEGWVEFDDKQVAKMVGLRLNTTPITNHKRSVHYGDLWNVKYLHRFKWEHLTEKVAYERRVREQKMRVELMHAKRENAAFADRVERGMVMDRIEERRKKRKRPDGASGEEGARGESGGSRPARKFRQTAVVEDGEGGRAKSAVLGSLV